MEKNNVPDDRDSRTACLNKDIVVSAVLTESTTSESQLGLLGAENLLNEVSTSRTSFKSTAYDLNTLTESNGESKLTDLICQKLSSEVAYFSSRAHIVESWSSVELGCIDDEGSICSKDVISDTRLDEKRKLTQISYRPLMEVRSKAQQSSIQTCSNNLYVTVVNSQGSLVNSEWINICRICHGGESTGNLLSPCQCKGSIALAHIHCLERWLKESATSYCELCRYHYTIVRQPKYGILESIFVFIRHPGDRWLEMICDMVGFIVYTTTTIVSTYTLSVICESISKSPTGSKTISSQMVGFTAVLGIAIIDFTYTSWLLNNLEKHTLAWQTWYRNNCDLKVILSNNKLSIKSDSDDTVITEQE